jgi:hypothetical protein
MKAMDFVLSFCFSTTRLRLASRASTLRFSGTIAVHSIKDNAAPHLAHVAEQNGGRICAARSKHA